MFIAASLDGFIARADGGLDWLSIVEREGEDYGYREFFDSVDTLLMGRRTYDMVAGFDDWPYAGKRCIVLAHAPPPASAVRHGEEFASGAPEPLLARLAAEGVRRVYVDGGVVIRQFLSAGLIDDLTLSVIPVLLHRGIPLFAGTAPNAWTGGAGTADAPPLRAPRLVRARTFDSGLVQLRYRMDQSTA